LELERSRFATPEGAARGRPLTKMVSILEAHDSEEARREPVSYYGYMLQGRHNFEDTTEDIPKLMPSKPFVFKRYDSLGGATNKPAKAT